MPVSQGAKISATDLDELIRQLNWIIKDIYAYIDQALNLDGSEKPGLSGTYTYYVSDTSGGSPTRKLTFTGGLLVSED